MRSIHLRLLRACALAIASTLVACVTCAAAGLESRTFHFARGATSATERATIVGRQGVDDRLRAGAGQSMSVILRSPNGGLAFNVLLPGSRDVAIAGGH